MIYKKASRNANRVLVTFEIPGCLWAERVHLVSDLNQWDRQNLPFRQTPDENWQLEVELEAGRQVRFRYLIDGDRWVTEWHADRHQPGGDGTTDSVVVADLPAGA